MDITLLELREKYDKFLLAFGISLIFFGIFFLISYKNEYYFEFISQILIQIGITIVIVDLVISKLGNKLQQESIKQIVRDVIGIPKNKKLISELEHINRPTGYQVIDFEEKNYMEFEKEKNKEFNMKVIEQRKVIIDIKQKNSHYYFDRSSPPAEEKDNIKVISLKIDDQELDLENKRDVITYKDDIENRRYFKIVRQLEMGKVYTIQYTVEYKNCMSDLKFGKIKKDYIETRFIELTQKAKISYKFPFDIKKYNIMLRRKDITEFKYEPIPKKHLKFDYKKNEVIVNETNLRNNDKIIMYYSKK